MTIDAMIRRVVPNDDGTMGMILTDSADPERRRHFVMLNPPPHFKACEGTRVTGDSQFLYVGGRKWAERVGVAGCRLIDREGRHDERRQDDRPRKRRRDD